MPVDRSTPKSKRIDRAGAHQAAGVTPLTEDEARLLHEVRRFLRGKVRALEAMLGPSRELRARLSRTAAFKRVDGLDVAERDPVWDTFSALDICFERAVEELIDSLLYTVRRRARPRHRPPEQVVH
jgi:hypothetical protein